MSLEKCGSNTPGDRLMTDMDAMAPGIIEKSSKGLLGGRIREIGSAASKIAFDAFHVLTLPAAEEAVLRQRENKPNHIFSD